MADRFFAGIGARETPEEALAIMRPLSACLTRSGVNLRSGGSGNADLAFESSVSSPETKQIFLPWSRFGDRDFDAKTDVSLDRLHWTLVDRYAGIAREHHPVWDRLSGGARKLHSRNVPIILGKNLDQPAEFVVCWTSNGKDIGGTGLGIRVALSYSIPVFNLRNRLDRLKLWRCLDWSGSVDLERLLS